jgi:L-alanine-DL-glutamate epimerase-like enolase superfamily enzyme
MPAVASLHATEADIDRMVEGMARHLDGGLQGIKVGFGKKGDAHLGFDHDRDVRFVRTLRAAIGPAKRIMIDLGIKNFWDVPTAIRRARAFEEFDVHWLEEPLGDRDAQGYRALRAGTSLRLAYGEKEWNYKGVQEIVETGTVDVIGLDPGRIEGITGFWKAAEICVAHRRQANAHNFSTAIVSAASQALSFASPACRELELQPVYGPAQRDLVDRPVWHTDGWINPPEGPGLGITVNEDLVRHARLDQ